MWPEENRQKPQNGPWEQWQLGAGRATTGTAAGQGSARPSATAGLSPCLGKWPRRMGDGWATVGRLDHGQGQRPSNRDARATSWGWRLGVFPELARLVGRVASPASSSGTATKFTTAAMSYRASGEPAHGGDKQVRSGDG
ncbi:hypothetical protein NL676_022001 [Syzygium grande]|nr:hypothetical protein NL676_022001 [Syzygium grande]